MAYNTDQLYALLPAIYRSRDEAQGGALRALVAILAEQAQSVEADVARLYDNLFIETCEAWVVPYLGDGLGARQLHPVSEATFSHRARVANTIGYRRRKGTASMLEQLAFDTTGYPARVVEFFQRVATAQNVNHVRPQNARSVDVRKMVELDVIGGPFESSARTADVRHVANQRGTHNLMNVAIFLWRLQVYSIVDAQPRAHADGTFSFSALGQDAPLFNQPVIEEDPAQLAEERNLPVSIRRRALGELFDPRFGVWVLDDERGAYIKWSSIACDLRVRDRSTAPGTVAVDPELGRFAFAAGERPDPEKIRVSYCYGFGSDVGGGPYARARSAQVDYSVEGTLEQALAKWTAAGCPDAVIEVGTSGVYRESLALTVPAGRSLTIRAGDGHRPVLELTEPWRVSGGNEHLRGGGALMLDGLLVTGSALHVERHALAELSIQHCTFVPGWTLRRSGAPLSPHQPSLTIAADATTHVIVQRSISGRFALGSAFVEISDSIIDGLAQDNLASPPRAIEAGQLRIVASTVLGDVVVRELLEASNVIFDGRVEVERRQTGCVRFSYLDRASEVPRRFRCQPDAAIEAITTRGGSSADADRNQLESEIDARLRPRFTDQRYGQPGYAQLSSRSARELREGAEDGSQMGVFHHLQQPHREANLRASLDEYLRVGMEAGVFYVT